MQDVMSEGSGKRLETMWKAQSDFLRRFLISLTRDIDLADDLLQDTYLKARAGIMGYRGGNQRAWLTAIARNAFNSHLRRRYVRLESWLSEDVPAPDVASCDLDRIRVRAALSDLPKAQRDALIMKHYGGYSYEDIAANMNCAVGTAKSRVSLAIRRLRKALLAVEEESLEMKCSDLSERMLLDYVCGIAPETERNQVENHLSRCVACRERAAEVGFVLHAVDAVEADAKGTGIIELNDDGTATAFLFVAFLNDAAGAKETLSVGGDFETIKSVLVNGEEAKIEPVPGEESNGAKLRLAHPLAPGERTELLMVGRSPHEQTGKGTVRDPYRLGPGKLIFDEETLFVMAVRLPPKAHLVQATPDPEEIRSNGATTVVWRKLHQTNEEFEFTVDYRL